MPRVRVAEPHDRVDAGRTAVILAAVGAVITLGSVVFDIATAAPGRTASDLLWVGASVVPLFALAVAAHRAPQRMPVGVYLVLPLGSIVVLTMVDLESGRAGAAAQVGLLYGVVFAGMHLPVIGAWLVAAVALIADAVVVLSTLEPADAIGDLAVVGAAIVVLTSVLVRGAGYRELLFERLRMLASVDPLTGVATRRALAESADRVLGQAAGRPAVRRASPTREGTGLVLIDLDGFKALNDTYGHPVGDAALVHVAQILRDCVRRGDTVARMGGDEFAILLPGARPADVQRCATLLDESLRHNPLRFGDVEIPLSMTTGVAHTHPDGATLEDLYRVADRVLYDAKRGHRDAAEADHGGPVS